MSKEEAIKELTELLPEEFLSKYTEAIKMGIEALEQEPCDDCISRQAVLDLYKKKGDDVWVGDIKNLPPVTPQPKMGRWIMPQMDDGMSDPVVYQVRCSICKWDVDPQTWYEELAHGFCPNCGAKMTKISTGAEGSDKE